MSSGMNTEQAKEYAKTRTYSQAVSNIKHGKGIKYRKATMIKLRELAEIADRLDRKTENSSEKPNNCEPQTIRCPKCGRTDYIRDMEKDMGIKGSHYKYKCINCNTYIKDEPQTERSSE